MGKNKNGKDRYAIMFQLSSEKLNLYPSHFHPCYESQPFGKGFIAWNFLSNILDSTLE